MSVDKQRAVELFETASSISKESEDLKNLPEEINSGIKCFQECRGYLLEKKQIELEASSKSTIQHSKDWILSHLYISQILTSQNKHQDSIEGLKRIQPDVESAYLNSTSQATLQVLLSDEATDIPAAKVYWKLYLTNSKELTVPQDIIISIKAILKLKYCSKIESDGLRFTLAQQHELIGDETTAVNYYKTLARRADDQEVKRQSRIKLHQLGQDLETRSAKITRDRKQGIADDEKKELMSAKTSNSGNFKSHTKSPQRNIIIFTPNPKRSQLQSTHNESKPLGHRVVNSLVADLKNEQKLVFIQKDSEPNLHTPSSTRNLPSTPFTNRISLDGNTDYSSQRMKDKEPSTKFKWNEPDRKDKAQSISTNGYTSLTNQLSSESRPKPPIVVKRVVIKPEKKKDGNQVPLIKRGINQHAQKKRETLATKKITEKHPKINHKGTEEARKKARTDDLQKTHITRIKNFAQESPHSDKQTLARISIGGDLPAGLPKQNGLTAYNSRKSVDFVAKGYNSKATDRQEKPEMKMKFRKFDIQKIKKMDDPVSAREDQDEDSTDEEEKEMLTYMENFLTKINRLLESKKLDEAEKFISDFEEKVAFRYTEPQHKIACKIAHFKLLKAKLKLFRGSYDESQTYLERAIEIYEAAGFVDPQVELSTMYIELSELHTRKKNLPRAANTISRYLTKHNALSSQGTLDALNQFFKLIESINLIGYDRMRSEGVEQIGESQISILENLEHLQKVKFKNVNVPYTLFKDKALECLLVIASAFLLSKEVRSSNAGNQGRALHGQVRH